MSGFLQLNSDSKHKFTIRPDSLFLLQAPEFYFSDRANAVPKWRREIV